MINRQLSKQGIRCPVSPECIAGSDIDPSRLSIFEVIRCQVTSFQIFVWNMLRLCHYGPALLRFWFQTDLGHKSSAIFLKKYRRGRPFLTMVTRWSRSTSNFYALIGQNLTGELMRKIYAASWILFTLTAEADRVLCQLVMFLTVLFHWMYKMKYSCYQECSVIWDFGCEMRRFSLSRKSDFRWHRFRFSPYSMRKRGFKILSDSGLTW